MGTDVHVIVLGGTRALVESISDRVEQLEARWSRFRPTSELCRLNDAAGRPVVVSAETFAVIDKAVKAWRATGERYDPTILTALVAAGYDRDFDAMARELDAAETPPAAAPGCGGIELDRIVRSVRLPAGVALDLGGIGKGYAADLIVGELLGAGAAGALVNMGGDLRAEGSAPGPHGWVVEIDDPLETGATGCVAIASGAVATSTSLRRAWKQGGASMHHLLDPSTGEPARTGIAAVTVIAGQAWQAETLAKAAFVAGPRHGERLIAEAELTGLIVYDDGRVQELPGLAAYRP